MTELHPFRRSMRIRLTSRKPRAIAQGQFEVALRVCIAYVAYQPSQKLLIIGQFATQDVLANDLAQHATKILVPGYDRNDRESVTRTGGIIHTPISYARSSETNVGPGRKTTHPRWLG